jgi:hypothetical protein
MKKYEAEEEEKENWESHLSMALANSTHKKGVKVEAVKADFGYLGSDDEKVI